MHKLNDFDNEADPEVGDLSDNFKFGKLFLRSDLAQLHACLAADDLCHRYFQHAHQLRHVRVWLTVLLHAFFELVNDQWFAELVKVFVSVDGVSAFLLLWAILSWN